MKALKIFNIIAIAAPVLLFILTMIDGVFFFYALVSLMFTGFIQTIVAGVFWYKKQSNRIIPFYFVISVMFFIFAFAVHKFDLDDVFTIPFWIAPAFLCVFLTWILYTSEDVLSENQD